MFPEGNKASIDFMQRYATTSVRDLLLDKVQPSNVVDTQWASLMKHVESSTLKESLLKIVLISQYVHLQCKAYVDAFVYIRKNTDNKISRKGTKSLRRDLVNDDKFQ